jgi:MFS family permease
MSSPPKTNPAAIQHDASDDNIEQVLDINNLSQDEGDRLRSAALTAQKDELPEGYFSSMRLIGTFVGIGLSLIGTYMAFTVGAAVIPFINRDIGPSDNASLFSIVWSTAQVVAILLFGRFSDRFGRRELTLASNALAIVGNILASQSTSMNMLVGANVILGLAAGPLSSYPLLTGELMTNKLKYIGTVLVVFPNVTVTGFGPYLGQSTFSVTLQLLFSHTNMCRTRHFVVLEMGILHRSDLSRYVVHFSYVARTDPSLRKMHSMRLRMLLLLLLSSFLHPAPREDA